MTEAPNSKGSTVAGYLLTLFAIVLAISAFFTFPVNGPARGPLDHSSTSFREPASAEAPLAE